MASLRLDVTHNKLSVSNTIAHPQTICPGFPSSLHHDDSAYDASGFEPDKHRRADGQHSVDIHVSPTEQHAFAQHQDHGPYTDTALEEPAGAFPSHFDMQPPPHSTHASWQALHDFAQTHAAAQGYAFAINTTSKNRSRIKLACVCYGHPKNTHKLTAETRVRKGRLSNKTGCAMWIEGKRQEDGTWLLNVGEAQHNHAGRPSEGWAIQRKRTWGVVGARHGAGGVTAKEELARLAMTQKSPAINTSHEHARASDENTNGTDSHSLERGGLVWKIVEQEMLRPNEPNQGRDRGVGRTVQVLQARLPGIRIWKRDVYNIRAQIKKARKAAGQQVGDGVVVSDAEDDAETGAGASKAGPDTHLEHVEITAPKANLAPPSRHDNTPSSTHTSTRHHQSNPPTALSTHHVLSASSAEVQHLRLEVARLKTLLGDKTKEVMEKDITIASLRSQLEYMSMAMLPS